jgi:membrane protease subunit (stomatin/prohibitin family)
MWFFDIFKDQTIDVIRWENPESTLLVKKWAQNLDEIKNKSSLLVDPGLASIFVHNWKIEAIQTESWKWSLETDNTPFLSSLKNIMSWFETHDKAQIYFIKTSELTNQKWWTPNSITYIDPIYDFPVELRVFGNFTFKIKDIENFWVNYVANKSEVSIDSIRMIITDRIVWQIGSIFAKKKVSYNEIDANAYEIAKELMEATKQDFTNLWLELSDFRIEDTNFTDKTEDFISKITSKSADIAAINKSKHIDKEAMENYSQIEKLNIAKTAASSGWSAWDMMWAWIWMAMWMNMANSMWEQKTEKKQDDSRESKLEKLKSLLDKWLINQEDFDKKKNEIINSL